MRSLHTLLKHSSQLHWPAQQASTQPPVTPESGNRPGSQPLKENLQCQWPFRPLSLGHSLRRTLRQRFAHVQDELHNDR
jgi:hypothetical protein